MEAVDYQLLTKQAAALLAGEDDWVAKCANLSALLYASLPAVNFAGFYRVKGGELILAPFQGKVVCVHIAFGHGVCGTAAQQAAPVLVEDVHQFPGHIACDSASQSELVIPVFKDGQLWGVLDLDSPQKARFTAADQVGLTQVAATLFAKEG